MDLAFLIYSELMGAIENAFPILTRLYPIFDQCFLIQKPWFSICGKLYVANNVCSFNKLIFLCLVKKNCLHSTVRNSLLLINYFREYFIEIVTNSSVCL